MMATVAGRARNVRSVLEPIAQPMKQIGAGAFLFFLIKGLAWLLVPLLPMLLAMLR